MSSENTNVLGIPSDLIVQSVIGVLLLFWGWREARRTYKATQDQLKQNPIVQGMTIAWDRDERERFLVLIERMVLATEATAQLQETIANAQAREMNETMNRLLDKLADKERSLSAMRVKARQAGRQSRSP